LRADQQSWPQPCRQGVNRGSILTRKAWNEIIADAHVAQSDAAPSMRGVFINATRTELRVDVRALSRQISIGHFRRRIPQGAFAAWLGLVPRQRSSGGRARLFGISKRGDRYLRTLLIHGARAALGRVREKQDPRSLWLGKMRQRRHPNIVAVALANKNARIAWSLLSGDCVYDASLSVGAA
jgi:Transposase IS116/IS110/IS902 family